MNTWLTRNIHSDEVTRSDTADRLRIDNEPTQEQWEMHSVAAWYFQRVRDAVNKEYPLAGVSETSERAILFNSWHRVEELNAALPNSSSRSRHMAPVDLQIVAGDVVFNGLRPVEVAYACVKHGIKFERLALYKRFTHIEIYTGAKRLPRGIKYTEGWKRYKGDFSEFL